MLRPGEPEPWNWWPPGDGPTSQRVGADRAGSSLLIAQTARDEAWSWSLSDQPIPGLRLSAAASGRLHAALTGLLVGLAVVAAYALATHAPQHSPTDVGVPEPVWVSR